MKYLNTLTPAEVKLILETDKYKYKELLKLTFMDLVLKNVIQVAEGERQASPRDVPYKYTYVTIGKNFHTHYPLRHEHPFIASFQQDDTQEILFKTLVKMAYQNAVTPERYMKLVLENNKLGGIVERGFWDKLLKTCHITHQGKLVRSEIKDEIEEVETILPRLLEREPDKAQKLLAGIGGNIFLLKNIDHELLKEMDKSLSAEMAETGDPGMVIGTSGCGWSNMDSYGDTFDSSCGGHGGGDSGCSGCGTGCSGCSGCGGCGGGD